MEDKLISIAQSNGVIKSEADFARVMAQMDTLCTNNVVVSIFGKTYVYPTEMFVRSVQLLVAAGKMNHNDVVITDIDNGGNTYELGWKIEHGFPTGKMIKGFTSTFFQHSNSLTMALFDIESQDYCQMLNVCKNACPCVCDEHCEFCHK